MLSLNHYYLFIPESKVNEWFLKYIMFLNVVLVPKLKIIVLTEFRAVAV